jgi:hypothetical protein
LQGHGCCKLQCLAQRGDIFWMVVDWRHASSIHFLGSGWRCTIGAVHLRTPKKCAPIFMFSCSFFMSWVFFLVHRCADLPPVSTQPQLLEDRNPVALDKAPLFVCVKMYGLRMTLKNVML